MSDPVARLWCYFFLGADLRDDEDYDIAERDRIEQVVDRQDATQSVSSSTTGMRRT
ncbi:MAG TPA: hypothetical protein PKC22_05140 [Rhodocyclaceae bacterium]|nr:hypothetical protein [Rhodocyclaceae bacterium]